MDKLEILRDVLTIKKLAQEVPMSLEIKKKIDRMMDTYLEAIPP